MSERSDNYAEDIRCTNLKQNLAVDVHFLGAMAHNEPCLQSVQQASEAEHHPRDPYEHANSWTCHCGANNVFYFHLSYLIYFEHIRRIAILGHLLEFSVFLGEKLNYSKHNRIFLKYDWLFLGLALKPNFIQSLINIGI